MSTTMSTDLSLEELKGIYREELHPIITHAFKCGENAGKPSLGGQKVECPVSGGSHDYVDVPFDHVYKCRHCEKTREYNY